MGIKINLIKNAFNILSNQKRSIIDRASAIQHSTRDHAMRHDVVLADFNRAHPETWIFIMRCNTNEYTIEGRDDNTTTTTIWLSQKHK